MPSAVRHLAHRRSPQHGLPRPPLLLRALRRNRLGRRGQRRHRPLPLRHTGEHGVAADQRGGSARWPLRHRHEHPRQRRTGAHHAQRDRDCGRDLSAGRRRLRALPGQRLRPARRLRGDPASDGARHHHPHRPCVLRGWRWRRGSTPVPDGLQSVVLRGGARLRALAGRARASALRVQRPGARGSAHRQHRPLPRAAQHPGHTPALHRRPAASGQHQRPPGGAGRRLPAHRAHPAHPGHARHRRELGHDPVQCVHHRGRIPGPRGW